MSHKVARGGVYVLYSKGEVVYVGESDNLYRRIGQHIYENSKEFDSFDIYETLDRKRLEGFLIHAFHPKYNTAPGEYWDNEYSWGEPMFTSPDIEDAIRQYEGNQTSISFGRIANELNAKYKWVQDAFRDHEEEIPAWNTNGYWVIDYQWFKENEETLRHWVMYGD